MNEQVAIRPPVKEDESFIFASWLKHFKHSSEFGRAIRHEVFFEYHRMLIDRILQRGNVRVAHLSDDPNVIIGYLVMEGTNQDPLIHFIFVKSAFREMGVAKTLCKGLNLTKTQFTHFTDNAHWIIRKIPTLTYNPYKI